jgi:hypothetical protein
MGCNSSIPRRFGEIYLTGIDRIYRIDKQADARRQEAEEIPHVKTPGKMRKGLLIFRHGGIIEREFPVLHTGRCERCEKCERCVRCDPSIRFDGFHRIYSGTGSAKRLGGKGLNNELDYGSH